MLYVLTFLGGVVATLATLVVIALVLRRRVNKQLVADRDERRRLDGIAPDGTITGAVIRRTEPLRLVPFDSPLAARVSLLDDYWAGMVEGCRAHSATIFTCEICDENPVLFDGDRLAWHEVERVRCQQCIGMLRDVVKPALIAAGATDVEVAGE